jgi:membrane protein
MNRLVGFGKDVLNGWLNAEAFTLAAALAYYAIFAIAPLLLISIYVASLFLDRTAAVQELTNEFTGVVGSVGSDAIKGMLDADNATQPQGWAGLVGLAVLIFAAAGFVGALQDALDKIWEAPPRPSGVWEFVKGKLFSFSLVLAAAFLLLVSLVLSTLMTAVAGHITGFFGLPEGVVQAVVIVANFLLSALIFAAIFKFVPSVPVTWQASVVGGLFTAVLFAAGRFALAWYLGREAQASAYGAATSLVLLLIWVYYSAQILFLGAQFSQSFQNADMPPRMAKIERHEDDNKLRAVPIEKYFANVVAALGLGFLLGAAVALRPSMSSPLRTQRRPSFIQTVASLLPRFVNTN